MRTLDTLDDKLQERTPHETTRGKGLAGQRTWTSDSGSRGASECGKCALGGPHSGIPQERILRVSAPDPPMENPHIGHPI